MGDPMNRLGELLERFGGTASRHELVVAGFNEGLFDILLEYRREVVRIRRGWYAQRDEHPDVVRGWRAGGRLTCVSAMAFHRGVDGPPQLHLEVPANMARLHDPDDPRRRIAASSAAEVGVVVHWTRHPGAGDRRAVAFDDAKRIAVRCYAAVSRESASRIV